MLVTGVQRINHWVEHHRGLLLAAGIGAAVTVNTLLWSRDKRRLRQACSDTGRHERFERTPLVSILLPAWNEAGALADCIFSIQRLRYPQVELVICAGGPDGTYEIARRFECERVIVLEQLPGEGKQGALRRCFERSHGEVIFLTDADCQIDDRAFEATLAPVIAGEAAATGSWRPLDGQLDKPFVRYQWSHHLYREVSLPAYTSTLDGRNAAIQRLALEQTAAFTVPAPIGTDYVLSKQLLKDGYRIRFVRDSQVQTEYPETFRVYARQISRWFRSPLVMGKEWGERDLARSHIRAGLAALGMLALPFLAMSGIKALWLPWSAASAHLLLSQVRYSAVSWKWIDDSRLNPRFCLLFPFYLVVGWMVMAHGLLESISPWQREKW